jgi:hypothetical protein
MNHLVSDLATIPSTHRFPRLRWAALAWLAIYVPAYAWHWGGWHFLQLCNLGVLATAAGIVLDNRLLLSSQAVAAPGIFVLFVADAGARLLTGAHLHGGTAYLWDAAIPLPIRLLSLYHLAWPVVLVVCLRRTGYDRRGLGVQAAIAAAAFAIGLWLAPAAENLNYVVALPGHAADAHAWAPWLRWGQLVALVYLPTHWVLCRVFTRGPVAARHDHILPMPAESEPC